MLRTDKSKFKIVSLNRRVTSSLNICTALIVTYGGGGIMVWLCFGSGRSDRRRRRKGYLRILQVHVTESGLNIIVQNSAFQKDNDPNHSFTLCQEFLNRREKGNILQIMKWPKGQESISIPSVGHLWTL